MTEYISTRHFRDMVLEYLPHQIVTKPDLRYRQLLHLQRAVESGFGVQFDPADFRARLERLADGGEVAIQVFSQQTKQPSRQKGPRPVPAYAYTLPPKMQPR